MQGMPHAAAHGSLPPEYWTTSLDSIYSDSQLQSQTLPQQEPASQQAPIGIDWNHPVFQQQQQDQQRSHLTPQTEPNHGIYSSIPQSWQPNPLHQPARAYPVSAQYQAHHQAPQFQQSPTSFESRSLDPSESSAFPTYSYQPNYLHSPQVPVQGSFPGRPNQQSQQSADLTDTGPQLSMPRYSVPSGYSQELLPSNTVDLTNDFPGPQTGVSQHQTINPQFLNPIHPNVQTQAPKNNLLFGGHAGHQAADGRSFNYYDNAFSVQPQIRSAGNAVGSPAGMYPSTVYSLTFTETY